MHARDPASMSAALLLHPSTRDATERTQWTQRTKRTKRTKRTTSWSWSGSWIPPAVAGTLSAILSAVISALFVTLMLSGCGGVGHDVDVDVDADVEKDKEKEKARGELPPAQDDHDPDEELRSPCPGSDEAFAFRALRLMQGRRPSGVRELWLLAQITRSLDSAGLPGRTLVARGLADGERYRSHWRGVLLDLLRIPRLGATSDLSCYAHPGAQAAGPQLAAWIRDAAPDASPPASLQPWTMADLLESSVRLDDLSPLLRAHLIVRNALPLGGNNVDPDDLERARRVFLGRGFEAAYLGRRLECIRCHQSSGATVLDSADPAADRTWPVVDGLEDMVYGNTYIADEASAYAVFRVAGVVDRGTTPWGADDDECPRLAVHPGHEGHDPLGDISHLGGPLGTGASVLDLERALHRGLEHLRGRGLDTAADDPRSALAAMVAVHLTDTLWREASGRRLTMSHGQPRNQIQQVVLAQLSDLLIREGYSLRELLVAIAVHPLLDLDEPGTCDGDLPPIFDPFPMSNDAGDKVRREDPWRLLDSAAIALGWPLMQRFPLSYGWADEPLIKALGVFIDETEPGHHGVDVVSALAWEAAVGGGEDPGWKGEQSPVLGAEGDIVERLIELASSDPEATIHDLAIALEDRIVQENTLAEDPPQSDSRAAIEALIGLPLGTSVVEHIKSHDDSRAALQAGLRRYVGALLATPQFTLAGLTPDTQRFASPPRLALPEATTQALCETLAPAILDTTELTWECDAEGFTLVPRTP